MLTFLLVSSEFSLCSSCLLSQSEMRERKSDRLVRHTERESSHRSVERNKKREVKVYGVGCFRELFFGVSLTESPNMSSTALPWGR